jgi:non-ribosomal peptide synthetase component E (peptide arylation enzyme)
VPSWTGLDKIGSCGVPLPQTEAKVVDGEGRALPTGSEGELWVKGPQVMQGYHRNEAATKETLTPDGWLRTGDVARIDDEGFVFVVDRLKELIKVKGLQVRHILNSNNLCTLLYLKISSPWLKNAREFDLKQSGKWFLAKMCL